MKPARRSEHWDAVYRTRDVDSVSWYRPHLDASLELIERAGLSADAAVIDIGGGASTLVDDLLERGFRDLTVLDVSERALDAARRRLGERAADVRWIVGDIADIELPAGAYDLWHDRAVFHFLIDDDDRAAYIRTLRRTLRPGGQAILATFAPDGPDSCSGLPVRRHSPEELLAAAGPGFDLAESRGETHVTPSGVDQRFTWVRLVRASANKGRAQGGLEQRGHRAAEHGDHEQRAYCSRWSAATRHAICSTRSISIAPSWCSAPCAGRHPASLMPARDLPLGTSSAFDVLA